MEKELVMEKLRYDIVDADGRDKNVQRERKKEIERRIHRWTKENCHDEKEDEKGKGKEKEEERMSRERR